MAKDLGKIKIEITEPKKPSVGVSGGGGGGSVSGENRELSRMIGDSLSKSTIKIAGLAGLDGVAKTIISAISKFSRVVERVTKTTGLQQAKTTDRALETSQKVTERIVKKPTEAYSPIGFRQPRPAPVGSIAKQLAPLYRKPTTIPAKGISPTSDFLNKLTWDVSKKVKPEDKVLSPPRPIAMSSVPPLSKPLEKLVQAQPAPVAQSLIERVRPALRGVQRVGRRTALPTTVAQSVIQKVQPSPIAQSLMERVRPALPQPRGVTVPREAVPKLTRPLARSLQPSAVSRMVPIRPSGAGAGAAANTAAKTAMRGVGTTMATAARGIMVALRAALLNPITAIIAVVLAVVALAAVAIAKFVATIWKWSEDLMRTRDRLAAFSGALAASKASTNINQLMRDIRSARRLEQPLIAISSQRGRIKELWHPIADLLTVIKSIVVSTFLPVIEMFVSALSKLAKIVANIVLALTNTIKGIAVMARGIAETKKFLSSWSFGFLGKGSLKWDLIATALEGMLDGVENSHQALRDILLEIEKGNRQGAAATINADMASTASRLSGASHFDPKTGEVIYRWHPRFGGGGNP